MEVTMKYYNKVLDLTVARWFRNCENNIVNEEYLFLENTVSIQGFDVSRMQLKIVLVDEYIGRKFNISGINLILHNGVDISLINEEVKLKIFNELPKHKFLFIPREYTINQDIFLETEEHIADKQFEAEGVMQYYEKRDPMNFVRFVEQEKDISVQEIAEWILRVSYLYGDYSQKHDLLLNKTSYSSEELVLNIMRDIELLRLEHFLTSRFAAILYRAATLNIKASTTEVGRYFHKCLHQKSQTLNFKLLKKINRSRHPVFLPDVKDKNFKAYDLLKSPEQIIKTDIAKKLLQFKDKTLDIETIATVTDLSVLELEALQK